MRVELIISSLQDWRLTTTALEAKNGVDHLFFLLLNPIKDECFYKKCST